jgi:hypothetical protein
MPRCSKKAWRPPQFWDMLEPEQQRWYRQWFIPRIVNDLTRTEFHLMVFEADTLLILRGHHHTNGTKVQKFFFPTKRGTFDLIAYQTRSVVGGKMFKMTLREEGE